ncbi:MAG: PIG-L family deacetylase [Acidimicrobiia bacterium]|nr:PIG-L family deacetylase [Acidimicrobiia bacterium]
MNRAVGPDGLAAPREQAIDHDPPRTALAICAHPDDPDFFAAGTFAKWASAGTECVYAVCTDGSLGAWEPEARPELTAQRREEQVAAAAVTGVADVVFLDRPDGFLVNSLGLRRDLVALLREHRPQIVMTHDPWKRWRLHPDHRECGFAACDAVATAREALAWPDTGAGPHRPEGLWLFETESPDQFEDVSATLELKIAALLEHRSQWVTTLGINDDSDAAGRVEFAERMRAWAHRNGAPAGLAAAESFRRIDV